MFDIFVLKMTTECIYNKVFEMNSKEKVKNLMFKLHKLEKHD